MGRGSQETGFTGWFWTTAVCAVVALVPAVLAVRLVRRWPEMGSRYDAPGTHTPEDHVVESERDLWNELDEGRDPTDTGRDTGTDRRDRPPVGGCTSLAGRPTRMSPTQRPRRPEELHVREP